MSVLLSTIIIPYREDRGWLDICRQSLYDQSLPNDEYEIIEQQGLYNQSKNVNDALKKAKGLYTYILHEDDKIIDASCLEGLKEDIEKEEERIGDVIAWAIGPAKDSNNITQLSYYTSVEKLLQTNTIHGGSCVYNTHIMQRLGGFDESLETGEEYDFNIRIAHKYGEPFVYDVPVRFYRIEGQNKSLNFHGFENREQRKQYLKDRIIKKYEALYFNKV